MTGEVSSLDETFQEACGANRELAKSLLKQLNVNESLNKKQEELMVELREVPMEKDKLINSNQDLSSKIFRIQSHSEVVEKRNSLL